MSDCHPVITLENPCYTTKGGYNVPPKNPLFIKWILLLNTISSNTYKVSYRIIMNHIVPQGSLCPQDGIIKPTASLEKKQRDWHTEEGPSLRIR
jgi:hypothetical protein